jgi:hypothetical protein
MSLNAVLQQDAAMRRVGITGTTGLVPIEELAPESWDYDLPTITRERGHTFKERTLETSSRNFALHFNARYPVLARVSLDGLLIAGSSVAQFLVTGSRWKASDVDVFVCGGLAPEAATARAMRFAQDMVSSIH